MKLLLVLAIAAGFAQFTFAVSGDTPLHLAALRGDLAAVKSLLKAGADVNATNAAGATPLHYGVSSADVVRVLLLAGANPNARSRAGSTPLHSAAGRPVSFPQARLLVDAGADIHAVRSPAGAFDGKWDALSLAAYLGDERTVKLLLDRGAAAQRAGGTNQNPIPVAAAAFGGNKRILEMLVERGASLDCDDGFAGHALNIALYAGHNHLIPYIVKRGADVHRPSTFGDAVPPIVWAAYDGAGDPAFARALIDRGADVNAASPAGTTALGWALRNGDTPLVAFLRSHGAKELAPSKKKTLPANAVPHDPAERKRMVKDSAQRAITLLQRSSDAFLDNGFVRRAQCVSCHQQTLPAVAFAMAQQRGFKVSEASIARQLQFQITGWSRTRDAAYEMRAPQPAPAAVLGYGLHGLHAMRHQPDELTAAMSWFLAETQLPNGSWPDYDVRPPMEGGPIVGTALTLKALQYFPPTVETKPLNDRINQARKYLERTTPNDLSRRVFRYQGLGWAGVPASDLRRETRELLALQRQDGGWAQLPGLESDSWMTGHILVALHEVGAVSTGDPAYQRGIDFLLRTQFDDGSWWVKSRTWPFQPHFDSQFPHGKDQWISAGGTAWAVMALLNTIKPSVNLEDLPAGDKLLAKYAGATSDTGRSPAASIAEETFKRDILPILEKSCVGCHGGDKPKGGLIVTDIAALLKGGQSGEPTIIPGKPDQSPLIRYVLGQVEDLEMPPLPKRSKFPALTATEVQRLRDWIASTETR